MGKINILIVDDHQLFIDGIRLVLRNNLKYSVVDSANTGDQALSILEGKEIDLVILDIKMPRMSGTQLAEIIKERYPDIKILVVTSYHDSEIISKIIDCEAEGYILKNSGKKQLVLALEKISEGGLFYSQTVTSTILNKLSSETKHEKSKQELSPRETEILKLIGDELTTPEISDKLSISPLTVETHRKNIFKKTHCKSVVGLIKYAIQKKII